MHMILMCGVHSEVLVINPLPEYRYPQEANIAGPTNYMHGDVVTSGKETMKRIRQAARHKRSSRDILRSRNACLIAYYFFHI